MNFCCQLFKYTYRIFIIRIYSYYYYYSIAVRSVRGVKEFRRTISELDELIIDISSTLMSGMGGSLDERPVM